LKEEASTSNDSVKKIDIVDYLYRNLSQNYPITVSQKLELLTLYYIGCIVKHIPVKQVEELNWIQEKIKEPFSHLLTLVKKGSIIPETAESILYDLEVCFSRLQDKTNTNYNEYNSLLIESINTIKNFVEQFVGSYHPMVWFMKTLHKKIDERYRKLGSSIEIVSISNTNTEEQSLVHVEEGLHIPIPDEFSQFLNTLLDNGKNYCFLLTRPSFGKLCIQLDSCEELYNEVITQLVELRRLFLKRLSDNNIMLTAKPKNPLEKSIKLTLTGTEIELERAVELLKQSNKTRWSEAYINGMQYTGFFCWSRKTNQQIFEFSEEKPVCAVQ
jgi:hypothetical protein